MPTTIAPSATSRSTAALPIPEAAPVTRMPLPRNCAELTVIKMPDAAGSGDHPHEFAEDRWTLAPITQPQNDARMAHYKEFAINERCSRIFSLIALLGCWFDT